MTTMQLRSLDSVASADVLDVIEQAFGRSRGHDWFQWKHREGPWGPSRGLVAVDDEGVAGVRLLLPWRLRYGDEEITAYRAVEAATAPRAQGRGVFSVLNRALMNWAEDNSEATAFFSTPNRLSRDGYAKLGWTVLEPIAHAYAVPFGRPASTETVTLEQALRDAPSDPASQRFIHTPWSATALRWRTDQRCGNRYYASRLRQGSGSHGLIYRLMRRRGLRILLIIHWWGKSSDVRALIAATAWRAGAFATLAPVGPGAKSAPATKLRSTGSEQVVAVWDSASPIAQRWPLLQITGWRLDMADLEAIL